MSDALFVELPLPPKFDHGEDVLLLDVASVTAAHPHDYTSRTRLLRGTKIYVTAGDTFVTTMPFAQVRDLIAKRVDIPDVAARSEEDAKPRKGTSVSSVVTVEGSHTISYAEAERISSLSKWTLRDLVAEGKIEARRSGRRVLIIRQSLHDYINGLPMQRTRDGAES